MRTRHLLAKTFCYQRQLRWDSQDNIEPLISLVELKTLQSELRHRPPVELQRAAHDLGINLAEVGLHAC
jgi:hypothetical protein